MITDAGGVPLTLLTTPANVPDGKVAIGLLDAIPAVAGSRGRPRFRPDVFQGDAGYGWQINIDETKARGIQPQLARPRAQAHGSGLGQTRYVVERTLSWFPHYRRLRHCFEKCGEHFQAFHELVAALICHKKWIAFHV